VRGGAVRPPDFEATYAADPDPWQVESSWYERRKLAVLLACLPRERYETCWEPGCGIGVATAALAARVGSLVASDGSATAVRLARERTRDVPTVQVVASSLPDVPVSGPVELVVAAEFLYYLDDLTGALDALWSACAPGAHLLVVHWAHHPHDAFRSGPETNETVLADAHRRGGAHLVHHRDQDFVLDVLEAPR
jgi:trans-aconitate methyltransferase